MRAEWWPGHPASLHHPVSGQELLRPRTPSGSWAGARGASGHAPLPPPHGRDTCRDTPASSTNPPERAPTSQAHGGLPTWGSRVTSAFARFPAPQRWTLTSCGSWGPVGMGGPAYFLTSPAQFLQSA